MGMNIAGCIVKKVITSQDDLEELFGRARISGRY
jgi:hypothetical protein